MSSPKLNLTSFAALPNSGQTYHILNVGFESHCMDSLGEHINDGNPVLSYGCNGHANQKWTIHTYPSCGNETAFTLQNMNTQANSSAGYLRVDQATNGLVLGPPQAWRLTEVSPLVYKITPFEIFLYGDGNLVITDVDEKTEATNVAARNQVFLKEDSSLAQQLWTFQK